MWEKPCFTVLMLGKESQKCQSSFLGKEKRRRSSKRFLKRKEKKNTDKKNQNFLLLFSSKQKLGFYRLIRTVSIHIVTGCTSLHLNETVLLLPIIIIISVGMGGGKEKQILFLSSSPLS